MSEGLINHYTGIRLRATGSGNLRLTLKSYDDINSFALTSLIMEPTTNKESFTLSNFVEQAAYVELKTTEIDEIFRISKIVVYIKPIATMYPG